MATRHHLAGLLIAAASCAALLGCPRQPPDASEVPDEAAPRRVVAVNYPLADFATRLAPEGVEVVLPVPQGVDPAFWKPSSDQVAELQSADLILTNGAGYARWTRYATLPGSRTVVTAEGCRDTFLPSGDHRTHRHGPEGEHAHTGVAFTTWLDLRLASCQAARVRDALIANTPSDGDAIRRRYDALQAELDELDARLRTTAKLWSDEPTHAGLLASHPIYQYLADAYGLSIRSLHWEPSQALGSDELRALDALLEDEPASLMLFEAAPTGDTVAALAARGLTVVVFDPVSHTPAEGDFVSAMRDNAARLACAMGSGPCP